MKNGDSIILLHASDFHIKKSEGNPLLLAHDIRKLFVFDAEQLVKVVGQPTALVFSGDIAFSGEAEQYDVADLMFADILKRLNLKEKCILVVPGNHDVLRKKAESLDARMLRDSLRSLPEQKAEQEFVSKRGELMNPIVSFQEFAMSYDCLIQGDNGYWEIDNASDSSASEYLVSDFQVLVRGISTVHASDRNDDQMKDLESPDDYGSHMYVARGQLACEPLMDNCPFRILVGHHPPSWWRFSEDRKQLADARYHLHLFGHEHQFSPQSTGNAICVKAGAVNPDNAATEQPRYNWIKITRENKKFIVRIWSRVFDNNKQCFIEDGAWPSGQGYMVDQTLDAAPVLIEPEKIIVVETSDVQESDLDIESAQSKINSDDKPMEEKKPPSMHAVRYALLSKNHAEYASVFEKMGYVPNEQQIKISGGLEYYEEALQTLLLPDQIMNLVEVMKEYDIDVN